jgi:molybdopterin synthase sulfur carrier subunit
MKVSIASPLRSYTFGNSEVEAEGETLDALLRALDQRFKGIRFRMIDEQDHIRPHIAIFINSEQTLSIETKLAPTDHVQILQALSGG